MNRAVPQWDHQSPDSTPRVLLAQQLQAVELGLTRAFPLMLRLHVAGPQVCPQEALRM